MRRVSANFDTGTLIEVNATLGTPVASTNQAYQGLYSCRLSGSGVNEAIQWGTGFGANQAGMNHWASGMFYFASFGTGYTHTAIISFQQGGSPFTHYYTLRMLPSGLIRIYTDDATTGRTARGTGFTASTGTWYKFGLRVKTVTAGNDEVDFYVNDTLIDSYTGAVTATAPDIYGFAAKLDTVGTVATHPDVYIDNIAVNDENGIVENTGFAGSNIRQIGVVDEATGASVADYRTRERTLNSKTLDEQYLLYEEGRVISFVGLYQSGVFTPANAAPGATTGNFYLVNNPASSIFVALRRVDFQWNLISTTGTIGIRYGLERFTTTTAATAAEAVFAQTDSAETHDANVDLVTASTGMTITNGNLFWSVVAPAVVTVGPTTPVQHHYDPEQDGRIILAPGEGVKLRQLDASTASDGRRLSVNFAWSEFTVP